LFRVIHDSLEWERVNGEVIVISFSSGKYFSLSGSAADIWHLLISGATKLDMVQLLSSSWNQPDLNEEQINSFIEECLDEGIIENVQSEEIISYIGFPEDLNRSKWNKPHLMTFGNLKDLIMVDPVHDSSLINWPLPGDANQ